MCKPHKYAQQGDSARQPVQVQREMGSPRRWNRHDVGVFEPRRPRKKDTKRWCRGKVGREHQPVVQRDPWGWTAERDCGPTRLSQWYCYHREVCSECGKVLRHKLNRDECPDAP